MVGYNDAIATSFQSKPCVFRMLDAFEDNWTVPILPQESNLLPGVRFARKNVPDPRPGCPDDVLFDLEALILFELCAKDRITEADLIADSLNERDIGVV